MDKAKFSPPSAVATKKWELLWGSPRFLPRPWQASAHGAESLGLALAEAEELEAALASGAESVGIRAHHWDAKGKP